MTSIVFTTRLTEADWDDMMRGWRCPALGIPGAAVDALFVDGERIDKVKFEVLAQNQVIRWIVDDRPPRATLSIALLEELALERDAARWKKLAIVLPVAATVLAAVITATIPILLKPSDPRPLPAALHSRSSGEETGQPASPDKSAGQHQPNGSVQPSGPIELEGGTSMERAAELTLGQPIRGYAGDLRWYRFTIKDAGAPQVRITVTNLRDIGDMWINAYDAKKHRLGWIPFAGVHTADIKFVATEPAVYYVTVSQAGQGISVYYELKVVAK
jgi:hypothetical protein